MNRLTKTVVFSCVIALACFTVLSGGVEKARASTAITCGGWNLIASANPRPIDLMNGVTYDPSTSLVWAVGAKKALAK